MLRLATVWVTHSLGGVVAAAALLTADTATALAQSPPPVQTPEPSRPAAAPAAQEDGSGNQPREPGQTWLTKLSLFDNRLTTTKPKSQLDSWLSGVAMNCVGCRGFETTALRPESTNATAPWALQGRWRRETALGVVSTGFVGVRNYALPLYTAMPLGGSVDPAALGSSPSTAFAPFSQWSLTAAAEKTLVTRKNGATVGVTADLLVPVATSSISVGDPRMGALTSPTLRFGIVFRW